MQTPTSAQEQLSDVALAERQQRQLLELQRLKQHQQQQQQQQLQFQQKQPGIPQTLNPQALREQQLQQHPQQMSHLQMQQLAQRGSLTQRYTDEQLKKLAQISGMQAMKSQAPAAAVAASQKNTLIEPSKLQTLMKQINKEQKLDPDVEEFLLEMATDMIASSTALAATIAKNRGSTTIEASDVLAHLERHLHTKVASKRAGEPTGHKQLVPGEGHKQRLAAVKKAQATRRP